MKTAEAFEADYNDSFSGRAATKAAVSYEGRHGVEFGAQPANNFRPAGLNGPSM